MTDKTLKHFFEVYKPKAPDEQKFVDKHVTIKHKDRNGNGDDVFNATNIKTIDRKKENHGYAAGEDEKVYEEVEDLDEISAATKDSYAQKASKQLPGLFKKSGESADGARKYYNRKNTVRKIANEEVEQIDEGMMKLSKVHIVHHHDHPAAKEFAKNYTAGMKGDHREGGPTEADEKASNAFHERYTGVRTREGFAGSGTHIYHDHKTGAKWKVDRHPNGKTFYGTDHIISHHTGGIHESLDLEEGEVLDTVAEDRVIRSLVAYYEELGEEVLIDDIVAIAEEMIDELSTATLQSYRKKARAQGNKIVDKMKMGGGDWSKDQQDTKTLRKRSSGAQMSGKTLRKRGESLKTEEVEQIDELSSKTLGSYVSKAARSATSNIAGAVASGMASGSNKEDQRTMGKNYAKRMKGIDTAAKKLTKEDVINRAIEKYAPIEEEKIPLDEQLVAKIENMSESHIHLILSLFEQLDESNQINLLDMIDQGRVNEILDFAISTVRGE